MSLLLLIRRSIKLQPSKNSCETLLQTLIIQKLQRFKFHLFCFLEIAFCEQKSCTDHVYSKHFFKIQLSALLRLPPLMLEKYIIVLLPFSECQQKLCPCSKLIAQHRVAYHHCDAIVWELATTNSKNNGGWQIQCLMVTHLHSHPNALPFLFKSHQILPKKLM